MVENKSLDQYLSSHQNKPNASYGRKYMFLETLTQNFDTDNN